MQFTNTLNNHPKNKRKKNYYHTSTPPLPLIVQHFIKDTDDSFLNTIKQINHEINQNSECIIRYSHSLTIQQIVDILHSHLNDKSNENFIKDESHQAYISPKNPDHYQNIIKQNKNVKTLKDTILNIEDDYLLAFRTKTYLQLINDYHLFDSKIIEQMKNQSPQTIQDFCIIQQQNEPRLKQLRHKLKPSPLKVSKAQGYGHFDGNFEKFAHLRKIINYDYDLSSIINIIKDEINQRKKDTQYWIHDYAGNKLMFEMIEKRFKTNQLMNALLNDKSDIGINELTLINKVIQHNPELLISKTNNQAINPKFNEILNDPDFRTTLKNIEHRLKLKSYTHLTKTQLNKLNYLINQLHKKDKRKKHRSDFQMLYKDYYGGKQYAASQLDKFDDFTMSYKDFRYSIQDANEKIIDVTRQHREVFTGYTDDDIEDDDDLNNEINEYDDTLEAIECTIQQITNQPYRFYETFYNELADPLKLLTIDEKQDIDAYISTKEIKYLQMLIKHQQDGINHTQDRLSSLNSKSVALKIVLRNNSSQKQNFKYANNTHSSHTFDELNYKAPEYNQALKQIVQHSINPQQQLRLPKHKSEAARTCQYYQIVKESLSQTKNQYTKQLIEEFGQIKKQYENVQYEHYNSWTNRREIDEKCEQLETIVKHHPDNASIKQLKESYLSIIINEQENGLNSKDHLLNHLTIPNFHLGRNVLNTILHRYPKMFKLVEPIVDAD